ncbi:hypothetical protein RJ641_009671, partial [Dillenia turbinata]
MNEHLKYLLDQCEDYGARYVYNDIWRVVNGIKKLFQNKQKLYQPYIDIIDKRSDNMLKKHLHSATFSLNPAFQYEKDSCCNMPEIMKSVLDVMGRFKIEGMQYVMDEITAFRT